MERPPKIYFCNKCGYVGISDTHPGCQYLAYPMANPEQLYIDHLEAELAALRASPAIAPEGWKIVPVEPTGEMVDAGIRSLGTADKFRAMLAAAPTPPSAEDRKDAERLNWLDEQGMIAIGHKGCGEYRYYAGDLFPAIRQVIDQARQEDTP